MIVIIISLVFAVIGIGNSFIIANRFGIVYWHIITQFFACLVVNGLCCLALLLAYRFIFKFLFKPDCFIFRVPKFEQKLYEKLKVKKWKTLSLDLGFLVGFKKNLKENPDYNIKSKAFYERFLYENVNASYLHASTILTCPLFYFILNPHFYITLGLSAFLIVFLVNIVPVILQRYNRPRLLKLYHLVENKTESVPLSQTA